MEAAAALTPLPATDPIAPIVSLDDAFERGFRKWFSGFRNFKVDYHNLAVNVAEARLGNLTWRPGAPLSLVQITYENDTDRDQNVHFREERKTAATVSLSITAGLRYRTSLSTKIAIKKIFEFGGEKELELSLSTTAAVSTSVEQTWSWDLPLAVPKRSRLHATALVSTVTAEPELEIQVDLKSLKNDHPHGLPYNKVYLAAQFLRNGRWEGDTFFNSLWGWLSGVPGFRSVNQDHVCFDAKARTDAVMGKQLLIRTRQEPIGGGLGPTHTLARDGASGGWHEVEGAAAGEQEPVLEAQPALR